MAPIDRIVPLRGDLEAIADPRRAADAARYMKGHFPFLGVAMADVHRHGRPLVRAGREASVGEILAAADELWAQPEREFHYVAVDLLRRWAGRLGADRLPHVEGFVRTNQWWDTIDALAAHVVGRMVAEHPELAATMDRWIDDPDLWVARTAILHQLASKEATDADRLFGYVDRRCGDTEFFIRKACGWALREYAKTDPAAVRRYVDERGDRLSPLTRREATKHLRNG